MITRFYRNGELITDDFTVDIVAHPQVKEATVDENGEEVVNYQTVEQTITVTVPYLNLLSYSDQQLAEWGITKQEVEDVPVSITRRQCAKQLLFQNYINSEEALAMARHGEPPSMVWTYINQLPTEQQGLVLIDFAADTYMRDNPLLTAIMQASGASSEEIDNFFRAAALQ